jgi:hypothetical protein
VSVIGTEEKRAFTVMVTIMSAGCLLPFQAIYQGKKERSCPNSMSPHYNAAIVAGFQFEFSGTKTYWANQWTMQLFVNNILIPYFEKTKARLGHPSSLRLLWTINVWSVYCSNEFLDWMYKEHPNILVDFMPGGLHECCTTL